MDAITNWQFETKKYALNEMFCNNKFVNARQNAKFVNFFLRAISHYTVINFADWEDNKLVLHPDGVETCQLQFFSLSGNLDDKFKRNNTELHCSIIVSNNIYVLPKYFILWIVTVLG